MLPTFVIGLREGVEAALIVGIIASFLRQEGRRDALRPMWLGVGAAVAICVAAGIASSCSTRSCRSGSRRASRRSSASPRSGSSPS